MISLDQLSLPRQLDIVFRALDEELTGLDSGIVFVQIRNNVIGKFGIRHYPVPMKKVMESSKGLTETQRSSFRLMALESLKLKKHWTHGEITYDFAVRNDMIVVDSTLESNYNLASLMIRYPRTTYTDIQLGPS
ncbi:O-methyltransferase [Paenibacillus gallinarum]|uniref:O-methyltransferase n=1 Tax=Paenibacillus gallinarum TaxID=2762232 RepID=A0ABR8T246_9BACL|nr:O-methyltransferase [Paenibacillus gallinarum]MBD7969628.1 O-methyltransferase [Paenibacillus gallinarum]